MPADNPPNAEQALTETLAPWRSPISRALHRNRSQAFCRFLQLATVRPDGSPANRTVVFRGFLPGHNQLMFISDRRSEKTAQITQKPNAEACWYFTKTREQFRLAGRLTVVTADPEADPEADTESNTSLAVALSEARQHLWQKISDSARAQFAWPHPKEKRLEDNSDDDPFDVAPPDANVPLSTFCLILLTPDRIDHLSLRGEPQNRTLYTRADSPGGWTAQAVNP